MRIAAAIAASLVVGIAGAGSALAQATQCANPNALGVARTVEIDTTGGPGFGFEQYKAHDFLLLKEVVLTFDDGPWPNNTRAVLEALANHCTKATFFPIGKHALWHPEILKEVAAAGHTVGGHTWSHANLGKMQGRQGHRGDREGLQRGQAGARRQPRAVLPLPLPAGLRRRRLAYLGTRNIAIFSHDLDSFDFKMRKPEDVVKSVMGKLEKKGKGIILMHDFQQATAKAMPDLLNELKAKGYKVVHMKAKASLATLPQWDEAAKGEFKGATTGSDRPTSSVVRTVDEPGATQPVAAKK